MKYEWGAVGVGCAAFAERARLSADPIFQQESKNETEKNELARWNCGVGLCLRIRRRSDEWRVGEWSVERGGRR